jgi:hypothetical protein
LTSIERTAYPQFRRFTTARVLHVFFTPSEDEVAWARERTETAEALLALAVALKCFQKMARFCPLEEVPQPVTEHVRRCLGLAAEVEPDHGADRTRRWHRAQVRKRQGATRDMRRARALAAAAIREAAQVRNHPPDMINVALERIIEASLELPAYSTLDDMATTIRAEVNEAIFAGIVARMGPEGRLRAQGLLATAGSDGRSMFNRLKKPAKRATWSRFRAQAEYLDEVDAVGDTVYWLEGVAPSKVADFAGEAAAQDIDTLSDYGDAKRLALVACLAHAARMRARDDLAEMLCKRVMDRATMFDLAGKLELVATSSDASVLAALEHARAWHAARRDHTGRPAETGTAELKTSVLEVGMLRHSFANAGHRRVARPLPQPGAAESCCRVPGTIRGKAGRMSLSEVLCIRGWSGFP